ncbi:helix-turn-helix transcriptional regulator [Mycolicibacterium sp. S2-37]|nr:helix-turn-helix transcriptional regulator [Mycolicibacterium sp. S2-37]
MHEFLRHAYGANMRLVRDGDLRPEQRPALVHARTDVGAVAIEQIDVAGELLAEVEALDRFVAVWTESGRLCAHSGGLRGDASADGITITAQPGKPTVTRSKDARLIAVLIDPLVLSGLTAHSSAADVVDLIRFDGFSPVSPAAAQQWKDTVCYVKDVVLGAETTTPLVLGQASRLLAAVTLSTFPHSAVTVDKPYDRTDTHPLLLRRAVEFIEENAGNDIALVDIATAVHVSSRAVQYMFRRHLDTTPLRFLRQLRLDRAHRDLQSADHRHTTVAAIAARWGFAHTGRFAVLYRQTYDRSPHTTLRSLAS